MSKSFEASPRTQRGDILLESLIGIVLMAIIGLGMTYASSRAAVSQRDMKVQNIAVSQMRDLIARYGNTLCSTNSALAKITLPTQTSTITVSATCTTPSSITTTDSTTLSRSMNVVLTTSSSDSALFGGIISVGDET